MGQVPHHYLLVGNGRVAIQMRRYFEFLNLPFSTYSRRENQATELRSLADRATHILLLISDDAISDFYEANDCLHNKVCVHMSGALVHPQIFGAHPLMTFTVQPLDFQLLQSMYIVIESGAPDIQVLLPGLPNQSVRLDQRDKALYHAWCVMSGNFTTLLWQMTAQQFQSRLQLPPQMLVPYLTAISANMTQALNQGGPSPLTGPLARNDISTLKKHHAALQGQPYLQIYEAFQKTFYDVRRSL